MTLHEAQNLKRHAVYLLRMANNALELSPDDETLPADPQPATWGPSLLPDLIDLQASLNRLERAWRGGVTQ